MPLYDGIQHGRGFNPFIQLPEYGAVIEPGGLATYAAFEQAGAKAKTSGTKTTADSDSDESSSYVAGMKGEQSQQRMMYTAIDQQLNVLSQKAAEDYAKYGSVERWRASEEGKDFFRKANYLQAKRQEVSNNNPVLNYNLKLFEEKSAKISNNGLDNLFFLRRYGKGFILEFGGENGIMTNGEYLNAIYNSPNTGVNSNSSQMATRSFSEMKDDNYKGAFDIFARGWYTDAQKSMVKGGPGFNVVNEQGQVKNGISPGDAVAYLMKTQYSSNITAVKNVATYLYDNLDENSRYDLAQQFYQDILGGNSEAINIMRNDKTMGPLLDQITESIENGTPVEPKKGEAYAWSRGNIETLLSQYGAIRISQMANNYIQSDVDVSMGGKVWDVGGDQTGQPQVTAEQAINSPKWILEHGQPVATNVFEANGDPNKTYNNVTTTAGGSQIMEMVSLWEDDMIIAENKRFAPKQDADGKYTYLSANEYGPIQNGFVDDDGVAQLPEETDVVVSSGGKSIYGPAFRRETQTGHLTNVTNSNSDGDMMYTVYNTYRLWKPETGTVVIMRPAKGQDVGGSKFVPVREKIEDLDEGTLRTKGIVKGSLNGKDGYFIEVRGEAVSRWASPGGDTPTKNSYQKVAGASNDNVRGYMNQYQRITNNNNRISW